MDEKTIIQGLECCLQIGGKDCAVCPYDLKEPICALKLQTDALELIKELTEGGQK